MVMLFFVELTAFLATGYTSQIIMDSNMNSQLRINFNVTMLDMSCDYATVDLYDVVGTNAMNVSRNIEKWQLDADGNRRMYQGRNREQHEVDHDNHLHPEIDELHKNGVHAQPLTK